MIVPSARETDGPGRNVSFNPGDLVARNYRLLQRLGKGALGEVWCARNETIDREVAIKFLLPHWPVSPGALAAFFAEAKASGKIRHPSIVELLDLGETDEQIPFVVMELLEADKLRTVLVTADALPVGTALRITAEVARAVQAAHEKSIVHLQIEPANILMHRDGRGVTIPKIVDFGIWRLLDDRPQAKDEALKLGLVGYQSPEQARHRRPLDGATDVWALGVLLHHCLIGAAPFRASNQEELLRVIDEERVAPNVVDPSIHPRVSDLVMDCLVTKPELRPTARALADRCEELLRDFDDHWTDLGHALDIPKERTIAHLSAIMPMVTPPILPNPPEHSSGKNSTKPPPIPKFVETLRPAAPPPGDDEAVRLSSSALEDAPPSQEPPPPSSAPISSSALEDAPPSSNDEAVPVSSSNLQEVPQPPPLASPMLLVTRSNAPPPDKTAQAVSPFMPKSPAVPQITLPSHLRSPAIQMESAPVSQIIAERLSKSGGNGLDHDAMDDLEAALLDRVTAQRGAEPVAATPAPLPKPKPEPAPALAPKVEEKPVVVARASSGASRRRGRRGRRRRRRSRSHAHRARAIGSCSSCSLHRSSLPCSR
jgi:serine/threonine protein kinase